MIKTKYCPGNVALLLIGIVVALADGWLAAMTAAFGADPVHDLRSGTVTVVLGGSLAIWHSVGVCRCTAFIEREGVISSLQSNLLAVPETSSHTFHLTFK